MEILLQAVQAVQRNVPALGLYLLFTIPASALVLAGNLWMGDVKPDTPVTSAMLAYEVAGDAFLVVVYAFAQSVVFARLGRVLDRPLWKCPTDGEALKRFFGLWVLLNMAAILVQRLEGWIPALMDSEAAIGPMFWLTAFFMAVYVPFGATVMFAGKPHWRELGETLGPLGRQWPKALSVFFFSGVAYILLRLFVTLQPESQRWLLPAFDVIAGYFDCLIFCATWIVCMYDRQAPQDDDFDYF